MFDVSTATAFSDAASDASVSATDPQRWREQRSARSWEQVARQWAVLGGQPHQDLVPLDELRRQNWDRQDGDWPRRRQHLLVLAHHADHLAFLQQWYRGSEPDPLRRRFGISQLIAAQLLELGAWLLQPRPQPRPAPVSAGCSSAVAATEEGDRLCTLLAQAGQQLEQWQPGASALLRSAAALLAELPADPAEQKRWLTRQCRLLGNARDLEFVWRHRLQGQSLQAIGEPHGLSRERVRQIVGKYDALVISAEEAADLAQAAAAREREQEWQRLQAWAATLPEARLPDLELLEQEQPEVHARLQRYFQLSRPPRFVERLQIAEALGLDVAAEEERLFAALVAGATAGYGFFTEDRLGRFLHWFARTHGEPGVMPMQMAMPPALKGHIERRGGQTVCAERYGLRPNRLTGGEQGRAFWTPVRLLELLHDCAEHEGDRTVMPSQPTLRQFLETDPRYVGKGSPNSAIAALIEANTGSPLSWLEVAQRYGFNYKPQTARVTRQFVRSFVRSLGQHIETLTLTEIYVLFERQGIAAGRDGQRTYDLLIDAFQAGKVSASELRQWGEGQATPLVDEILATGQTLKQEHASRQEYDRCLAALLASGCS